MDLYCQAGNTRLQSYIPLFEAAHVVGQLSSSIPFLTFPTNELNEDHSYKVIAPPVSRGSV